MKAYSRVYADFWCVSLRMATRVKKTMDMGVKRSSVGLELEKKNLCTSVVFSLYLLFGFLWCLGTPGMNHNQPHHTVQIANPSKLTLAELNTRLTLSQVPPWYIYLKLLIKSNLMNFYPGPKWPLFPATLNKNEFRVLLSSIAFPNSPYLVWAKERKQVGISVAEAGTGK